MKEYVENTKSQMRKGTLEFFILLIIASKKQYAADILTRLKEQNVLVAEGTLYPLLSRLKKEALLSYEWQESTGGPPRKYYYLTEKGEKVLKELITSWDHFNTFVTHLKSCI
jgi:PadR family transcriptional regulator PadR